MSQEMKSCMGTLGWMHEAWKRLLRASSIREEETGVRGRRPQGSWRPCSQVDGL